MAAIRASRCIHEQKRSLTFRIDSKIQAQEGPKSRRSSLVRSVARGGLQYSRANILIDEIGNVRPWKWGVPVLRGLMATATTTDHCRHRRRDLDALRRGATAEA